MFRHPVLFPFSVLSFVICFIFFILLPSAFAGDTQMASPKMIQGKVAATPISIPRPIRLERLPKPVPVIPSAAGVQSIQAEKLHPTPKITDCRVQSMSGNEMLLELTYTFPESHKKEVFAGAFIYSSRKNAVNAGYKPQAVQTFPNGTTDLTMVMPQTPFTSTYIETFLIRGGKIITKAQFKFPFAWDGTSGKFLVAVTPASEGQSMSMDGKKVFCQTYADYAVQQFNLGRTHHLPGIVPPAWSNDKQGHYNWCLQTPKAVVSEEDYKRVQHLKIHLPSAVLQDLKAKNQLPAFDPGRGP